MTNRDDNSALGLSRWIFNGRLRCRDRAAASVPPTKASGLFLQRAARGASSDRDARKGPAGGRREAERLGCVLAN